MAYARDEYTATASQTDFTITFPYQEQSHVTVYQAGTLLTATVDYTLSNSTTVKLVTGASTGDIIVLLRSTSRGTRLVDFVAGTLTEADLDNSAIQGYYLAQEALDIADFSISLNAAGGWDGASRLLNGIADPVVDQDAATKNYVDQAATGTLLTPLSIANGGTGSETGVGGWSIATASTALPSATSLDVDMELGFDYRLDWFGMEISEIARQTVNVYESGAWVESASAYYNSYEQINEGKVDSPTSKTSNTGLFRSTRTGNTLDHHPDAGWGTLTVKQSDHASIRTNFSAERHHFFTGNLLYETVSAERAATGVATKFRLINNPTGAPSLFTAGYYVVWKIANGNPTS